MAGPILIAYDGSPSARDAVGRAARLLGPRPTLVVHVWDPIVPAPSGDPLGLGAPMVDPQQARQVDDLVRDNAEAVAADGARLAAEAGLTAEPLAVEARGSTWSTILDVAREREAELVVIGARGHSAMRSMLLGSVSQGVVHHARVPVLVLPPAPDEAERS